MDNAEMMRNMKATLAAALEQARTKRQEEDRRYLMSTVGQDIAKMMGPFLAEVAASAKVNREEMRGAMLEVMANVNARELPGIDTKPITDAIERAMGGMYIPEPKVTVTSPTVNVPDIKMPDHMDIKGWVNLMTNGGAVGHDNPLPVMLMDTKGNPLKLFDNLTQIVSGGGGGKHDFFTVRGFGQSAFADHQNADGRLRVSVETGGSGLTDAELRAAHLDVQQVSGAIDSVYVTGASGTLAANIVDSTGVAYSGSNPLPIVFGASATSAVNIVDSTGVAYESNNPFPVAGTVVVSSVTASVAASLVDSTGVGYSGSNPLPIVGPVVVTSITNTAAANIVDSTGIAYEGANPFPITVVTSATASLNASLIDSSGVGYSGSNPVPVVIASGAGATQAAALVDSTGVQYSGSNPVPISGSVSVSGSVTSTVVTGPVVSDGVDDGSAPVKTGGIARTANPTAVAAGDTVTFGADKIGRQITRPVQVRDLVQTAYAQVSTGTEATLYQAASGVFADLIYVMGANNSDAAVSVDIRAGTANGVVMTLQIPASGTAGVSLPVPIPQDVAANTWTIDLPDITGTTVSVSALFSKEV